MSAENSCILGRAPQGEGCFGDDCKKCGWNRKIAGSRLKAVRKGLLFPDENGRLRLVLKNGRPWPGKPGAGDGEV